MVLRFSRTWTAIVVTFSVFGCNEPDAAALRVLEYDDGYVRFVDAGGSPRQEFSLRGEMIVKLYENYVTVFLDDSETEFVIPRDRLVYVGSEIVNR